MERDKELNSLRKKIRDYEQVRVCVCVCVCVGGWVGVCCVE